MEWELVSEGSTHRFGAIENVLVCMYWGMPEPQSLRDRLPWAERCVNEYGSIGQLVVLDRSSVWGMPSAEWRDESRAQSKRFESVVDFASIVLEPDDVKSAMLRTMIRGLSFTLALDRRFRIKFFDDLSSGASYAEEHGRVSGTRLSNVAEALRPHAAT